MTTRPAKKSAPERRRLDAYRDQAQAIILARQDPQTGLLPASTAITVHGDYTHAWVRDNVYSILAVWALALAYRHEAPRQAAPLERSVVQLMRGLLAAMMKQAHKVEAFKHTQNPLDALHAKYDTKTGEPVVGDTEWGHLQLDATAIFVLLLAQMSAAKLRIVQSADEVSFVQNLVYYLAKAYRTPDYGIWERGHKRNEGVAEINASSVGMAKAALEAIAGVRFLDAKGAAIHVMADDIAHARNTLEALLPRESESKETDAALLSIVGFPAFAIDDRELETRTRAEIVAKLQGRYGCKRFLRDGHQTVLEDHSRMHYEPGELRQFEHIESEWPLFFTYLLLDAVLRGDAAEAQDYRTRLEGLLQTRDGQQLLPELYFVPAELIDAERALPQSQTRVPNENVPLVWAQSLYLVGVLLQEGFIDSADLDPLERAQHAELPHEVPLLVAVLAEDELVQSRLAALGIASETLPEVAPVRVRYAQDLEAAYTELGRNAVLGLSGRPAEDLGSLTTSQLFTLGAERFVFLPSFFDRQGFYLTLDNRLLVDEINAEAAYISRHWRRADRPLLTLLITEPMLAANGAEVLIEFLKSLASGDDEGWCLGKLATLLDDAGSTAIDWLRSLPAEAAAPALSAEVNAVLTWEEAATRPLTAARAAALERNPQEVALLDQLARSRNPYEQIEVLALLWRRHGPELAIGAAGNVRRMTEAIYARASRQHLWGVLRRAAGLLDVIDESLEDAVAQIVVNRKRVAVGRSDGAGAVIAKPCGNTEIAALLRAHGGGDARARVLIQEAVLLLATLIKAEPELFKGTLTLRPWHLVLLINGGLAREHGVTPAEAFDHLLDLSPHAILGRLREVITREQEMASDLLRQQRLHHSGSAEGLVLLSFPPSNDPVLTETDGGWHAWRDMTGVMTRVPEDFYARVWELLQHCSGLVIGDLLDSRNRLDSALMQADMTPAEPAFALRVEDLLNKINEPAYRQLSIEALLAVSDICRVNADLKIEGQLVIDVLLNAAVRLSRQQAAAAEQHDGSDGDDMAAAWQAFYAMPPHQVGNFVMAALVQLLREPVGEQQG